MVGLSMTGSCFFKKHEECAFPNECKCVCHLIIIKTRMNYISHIEEIEKNNLEMAQKVFNWDKWEKQDIVEFTSEIVTASFNWKRWLRLMVEMSSSNYLRNINDDFAETFEVCELMPFCEDEDCKEIFWDFHYESVITNFIPELKIIAFNIWFVDHSSLHLHFPIWEMSEQYL